MWGVPNRWNTPNNTNDSWINLKERLVIIMMTIEKKDLLEIKCGVDLTGEGVYIDVPLEDCNKDVEDIFIDISNFIYDAVNDEEFMKRIVKNEHGINIRLWADLVGEVVE